MFNTFLYDPLYNILIFLINIIPGNSVGLAIILLTILVKITLSPLSHKSSKSQIMMKKIEPELKKIREKYKDKQQQAQKTMDLYKEKGINPFSGCFLIIIQLPVILALYWVFVRGLPEINIEILYPFVFAPDSIQMNFLGVFDLSGKSFVLAGVAAISQFFQMKFVMPENKITDKDADKNKPKDFKEELTKNMTSQMKYMLPIIIFFVAYSISAAVALYWAVSNMFSIVQEYIIRNKLSVKNNGVSVIDNK